jgi:hypothetical protein
LQEGLVSGEKIKTGCEISLEGLDWAWRKAILLPQVSQVIQMLRIQSVLKDSYQETLNAGYFKGRVRDNRAVAVRFKQCWTDPHTLDASIQAFQIDPGLIPQVE